MLGEEDARAEMRSGWLNMAPPTGQTRGQHETSREKALHADRKILVCSANQTVPRGNSLKKRVLINAEPGIQKSVCVFLSGDAVF